MASVNVFVYGTLMADQIACKLLGRNPATSGATLPDHIRYRVKGVAFPAIVAKAGESVEGKLLKGLNAKELKILDGVYPPVAGSLHHGSCRLLLSRFSSWTPMNRLATKSYKASVDGRDRCQIWTAKQNTARGSRLMCTDLDGRLAISQCALETIGVNSTKASGDQLTAFVYVWAPEFEKMMDPVPWDFDFFMKNDFRTYWAAELESCTD